MSQKPASFQSPEMRKKSFATEIRGEQRDGWQTLLRCLMFITASGITLIAH